MIVIVKLWLWLPHGRDPTQAASGYTGHGEAAGELRRDERQTSGRASEERGLTRRLPATGCIFAHFFVVVASLPMLLPSDYIEHNTYSGQFE